MFQSTLVEIKVGSSMNSLCFVELSCINDILISDQCIPRTCVFYNTWKKNFFFSIRDQIINFHAAF